MSSAVDALICPLKFARIIVFGYARALLVLILGLTQNLVEKRVFDHL